MSYDGCVKYKRNDPMCHPWDSQGDIYFIYSKALYTLQSPGLQYNNITTTIQDKNNSKSYTI